MVAPAPAAVRMTSVMRRFGRGRRARTALDRLSLTVPAGSVYGLAGNNGAGKTTALLVAMGLLRADAGRLRTAGLDPVRDRHALRRRTAFVPERDRPQAWLKLGTWLDAAADAFDDWDAGRAAEWSLRFELDRTKRVEEMSKGQLGRAKLAVALARRPSLAVLDEPWDGLDPGSREMLIDGVLALAAGGCTVLACSHNLAELARVMDHAGLLKAGRCVWEGPAATLRDTHGLLGSPADAAPPEAVAVVAEGPGATPGTRRRLVADRADPALAGWLAAHPAATLRAPSLVESFALLCGQAEERA